MPTSHHLTGIIVIVVLSCLLPAGLTSQVLTNHEKSYNSSSDSVPIVNKKGKIVGYTDADKGYTKGLLHSGKSNVFYDKKTSQKAIKMNNGDAITNYGDQYLNSFIQPNLKNQGNFTLDSFGSGDVDNDGDIDWTDYNLMVSGTQNDRSKVTGTGTYNQDKALLLSYLKDEVRYLSAHYDWSQTSAERISWYEKTLTVDPPQPPPLPWCGDYTMEEQVIKSGVEHIWNSGLNFNIIDTTYNMRFNLPVNQVSTISGNNVDHWINSIAIGDTLISLATHYFMEPQIGQRVFPGGASIQEDSYLNIKRFAYVYDPLFNDTVHAMCPIIDIDIENGQVISTNPYSGAVLYRTLKNVVLQGTKPVNTTVNWANGTVNLSPDNTGWPTGVNPSTLEKLYSDSTNQGSGNWNPNHYNFTDWRNWRLKQDQVMDTTLAHTWTIYNRPAQVITVQDIDAPAITQNSSQTSIPYTQFIASGIIQPTVTDNCGVWDSTYVLTTTQGSPGTCPFYEFIATGTTNAWDPSSNDSISSKNVDVYLDPNQWTYFPANTSLPYWIPTTMANIGGPATAMNPAGPGVGVTWAINTTQNPDTLTCGNVNYLDNVVYTATDSVCGDSIQGTQIVTKYKPMSLLCTYFPPDTTVGKNDSIGPQYGTGEPTYLDTLKTWYPTGYLYEVVRIDSNQYYETWNVIFNGTEYTCNTVSGDSIQTVLRDLEVGILDKFEEPSFTLYPNPTKGEIHIKFNDIQARPEEIRITDLTGRTLKEIIVDPNVNEVVYTLSGLPEGMYLINLGGETKKLVINKFSD